MVIQERLTTVKKSGGNVKQVTMWTYFLQIIRYHYVAVMNESFMGLVMLLCYFKVKNVE